MDQVNEHVKSSEIFLHRVKFQSSQLASCRESSQVVLHLIAYLTPYFLQVIVKSSRKNHATSVKVN